DVFVGIGGRSGAVFGDTGDDWLVGGSHGDRLHGGAGDDTLTGGGGPDRFFFDTALNATNNVDRIVDFAPGYDSIMLSAADFAGIGPIGLGLAESHFQFGAQATTAAATVIYNSVNGYLSYDPDGNGAKAAIHFATLAHHLPLHNTDFFITA